MEKGLHDKIEDYIQRAYLAGQSSQKSISELNEIERILKDSKGVDLKKFKHILDFEYHADQLLKTAKDSYKRIFEADKKYDQGADIGILNNRYRKIIKAYRGVKEKILEVKTQAETSA